MTKKENKNTINSINVIILNRMYVGDYLGENIGNEVINLIKPDHNMPYNIYINHDGLVKEKILNGEWKVTNILFTRWVKREYRDEGKKIKTLSMVEVIAKTDGEITCFLDKDAKKTEEYHEKHTEKLKDVSYGEQKLEDIFGGNSKNNKSLYVTFQAENIKKTDENKRIFLIDKDINNDIYDQIKKSNEEYVYINEKTLSPKYEEYTDKKGKKKKKVINKYHINFSKTSLKQYITEGLYKTGENYKTVYNNIKNNVINKDFWNDSNCLTYKEMKDKKIITETKNNNFIEIIKKEYDELIYTNFFFHIFKSNPELFYDFATSSTGLGISKEHFTKNFKVLREDGNIDLLIDDNNSKTLIVIENKIKSGINGIRHDEKGEETGNQLSKYIHYTYGKKVKKGSEKTKYVYEDFNEDEEALKPYKNYTNRYFYIFAPKYKHFKEDEINNNIDKYIDNNYIKKGGNKYKIVEYDKIYSYFYEYTFENDNKKPQYYDEFLYALKIHKYDTDNIQERQMFERFAERIQELELPPPLNNKHSLLS